MAEAKQKDSFRFSLAALILIVVVLLSGIYFAHRSGTDPNTYSNDFNVYFFAARELLQGHTPYENSLGESTAYLYPPLLAELLMPLALLPLPVAAYLWFLISAAATFAALRMSSLLVENELGVSPSGGMRRFNHLRLKAVLQTFTALMLLRFILDNFDYGQVNLIVTALAIAHVYFYTQNRKPAAALALALAATLKLTPAILLAYHLAKGRWRFVAASAVLTIGLLALSFAPFGSRTSQTVQAFYNRTIKNERGFDLAYHGNQSLRGAIERLRRVDYLDFLRWELVAGGLFFLALLFVYFRASNELSASAPFFCLAVMLSPLSWKQHFVILMPPIAWLLGEAIREEQKRQRFLLFTILVIVFVLFNFTSPKLLGVAAAEWCDAHSLILLGTFLIYLASILRFSKTA